MGRRLWAASLLGLAMLAGAGCRGAAADGAPTTAPPVAGPVLASWGRHVVLAWVTDRPRTLHWAVSVDGGRHFGARTAQALDDHARGDLAAAVRLVEAGGARAYVSEAAVGFRQADGLAHVVLYLVDGVPEPAPPPPDLADALEAERWSVEPVGAGAALVYAATTPAAFGERQRLLLAPPSGARPAPPAIAVDGHGALAVAWLEALPGRQLPALVIRRYAGRAQDGAPVQAFDVAQIAADAPAETSPPALAAVPTCVVAAWYADGRLQHRVLMLDLLCAPPGGTAALSRSPYLLQRH
jgi:hypothetical protein